MTENYCDAIIKIIILGKEPFILNICKKNFGFVHKSGILLPVSSLPSAYGIGSFGKAAYDWIDFLDRCGQTVWQVLPLNPTSYGDSPYQSPASVAGNPYFIDLDLLHNEGLLTKEELGLAKRAYPRIDYGDLFVNRYPLLRVAHSRFFKNAAYRAFCEKNAAWLEDYALFMALKVHYGFAAWTDWAEEHRDAVQARTHASEFSAEMDFWKWVQYEFMKEWQAVRRYAAKKHISVIGDMPIYVAHDSMDVWRAPGEFCLDENYNPTAVAGCPPDAYAAEGQLWGNPLYRWDQMKEEGFSWWLDRVDRSFALYDLLRIDHFRGFASYYSIPAGDRNAMGGHWEAAPGEELFDAIKAAFPNAKIIAEDLGFITDDVRELLAYTGFPGMKVLQFAFYNEESEYLPRCYTTDNCIVYTSSHDSDCTRSWYLNADKATRARFRRECPRRRGQSPTAAAIELAMKSRANLAVISLQDYMELTNEEGRINIPSVAEGNWTWRLSKKYQNEALAAGIVYMSAQGKRLK